MSKVVKIKCKWKKMQVEFKSLRHVNKALSNRSDQL